jgi:hypothetical protein
VRAIPGVAQTFTVRLDADTNAPPQTLHLTLNVAGNNSGTAALDVDLTDPPSLSDYASVMSGSTASSKTPMGIHFEAAAAMTHTAAQLAPLADPKVEPSIPASTTGLKLTAFPVHVYPHGIPTLADVNQRAIGVDGDAVLGSMAYSAPDFVMGLITDNGNGTFSVAMFDPNGNPITVMVDSSFMANSSGLLQAVAGEDGSATWATVLEKAAMKYNDVFKIVSDFGGIGSEYLTPMFTGSGASYAFAPGTLSPTDLKHVVSVALSTGQFITGGFNVVQALGVDNTVALFGYTVLVPSNAQAMVSMRNPWGFSPTVSGGDDLDADGVLSPPETSAWANTIDLRVISPGAAGVWVNTSPFVWTAPTNASASRP